MAAKSLYTLITGLNTPYKWSKSLLSLKVSALLMLFMLAGSSLKAQIILGSLTINSSPVIAITSISDYENGVAITDQTLTITTNASMNWVLKVRAVANLDRMGTQIPVSNIGMKVTNLPASAPEIMLSTSDQDIVSGTSVAVMQSIPVEIRYRATGGNSFLQPEGDYSTNLTFTLTMVNL